MSGRGKILVVDDKENVRNLVRDILAPSHDLVMASDGATARTHLEAERFEVVLTDVRMPDTSGFDLVRLIKQRWPQTEIVLMTAYASVADAVEAIRQGAYDYVEKPFDPDDLMLAVARALERHREQSESTDAPPSQHELAALSYREALASARDRGSRAYLIALLSEFAGNVSRAADRAGLERESLHRLLRRHGIRAEAFRRPGQGGEGP